MKKKGFIATTSIFLISLTAFFVLIDRIGFEDITQVFYRVRVWHIAVIIGMMLIYFTFFIMRWQRILKLEGFDVPLKNLFIYRLAGHAVSYLTPASDLGGEPVMAHLASKDNSEISFTKSLAAVVANRIVGLIINLSLIILSFTYIVSFFILPEDIKFLFYVIFGAIILLIAILYFAALKDKHPLKRVINFTGLSKINFIKKREKTIEEFDNLLNKFFHHNPKELFINLMLSTLTATTAILIFWALAHFLGFNLSFFEALVARSINSIIGSAIPVPAAIGFGEAGESAWFSILGLGAASGFSFYLILRTKDIFYALIGLICLFYKGMGLEVWRMTKNALSLSSDEIKKSPEKSSDN